MSDVTKPHDAVFKKFGSNKAVVIDWIQSYLPADIVEHIDLDSLEQVSVSFVDEALKDCEADLLYTANYQNQQAYFYLLFEHQSKPELKMPLRSSRYLLQIMERHIDQHNTQQVPYVFPLVFYNGKAKYHYACDIRDMMQAPADLVATFRLGKFQLVDLNDIDDEDLRAARWSKLLMFAMKHAYSTHPLFMIKTVIKRLELMQKSTPEQELKSMQKPLIYYIMNLHKREYREEIIDMIRHSESQIIREQGQTIADSFREEGRKETLAQLTSLGLLTEDDLKTINLSSQKTLNRATDTNEQ